MEDMFSFFQDFENFDAQHYIETVKTLLQTDAIFQTITFSLLVLIILFIVIVIIGKLGYFE